MMSRASTFALGLSLLCLTFSQPHDQFHHKHKHRDAVAVATTTHVLTQDVSVSYDVANIVIYVDHHDKPYFTSTLYKNEIESTQKTEIPENFHAKQATDQPQDTTPGASPSAIPQKGQESTSSIHSRPFKADNPQSTSGTSAGGGGGGGGGGASGGSGVGFASGVTYSPYNQDHSCKSETQVAKDLADISDYQVIRLYGTDCDQVATVLKAINGRASIFAGIFDIKDIQKEVDMLASAVNGGWNRISTVSVGNEQVNSGAASVEQVTSAIGAARSALRAKGYTGPVITVDTMMAIQSHPQLCEASDYCAINCHAFFDGNVLPSDAGKFVSEWAQKISKAAGGKRCVVAESGWPTQGSVNGKAIPGQAQHRQAIQSLKASFSKDLILFTLYNDMWKSDRADTHSAEKYWGMRAMVK